MKARDYVYIKLSIITLAYTSGNANVSLCLKIISGSDYLLENRYTVLQLIQVKDHSASLKCSLNFLSQPISDKEANMSSLVS